MSVTAPPLTEQAPAVRIEDLTVERGGRVVLTGIDGRFGRGLVTGLFGPSGSGKSTLIRAVAGVQAGVRGSISVLGGEPGSAAVRAALGYMTQAPSVYEDLTVAENVGYFAAMRGTEIGSALDRVQLTPWADQLVRNLSGGLWRLFRELASEGATLLVSSHVLDEGRHCDELILLREGHIVAQVSPSELAQRTGTDDLDEAFIRLIERA